jgi:hypothetical protein
MKSLRAHVRDLQILENKAAEKAGMRFLLLRPDKLFGKKGSAYTDKFVKQLEEDIAPEILEAAKMGKRMNKEIKGKAK